MAEDEGGAKPARIMLRRKKVAVPVMPADGTAPRPACPQLLQLRQQPALPNMFCLLVLRRLIVPAAVNWLVHLGWRLI